MAFTKKQTAVVYLDTNKAFFYIGTTGAVITLDFPPDVISDLDLVDGEKLEHLIDTFVKANNIGGEKFETHIVFSPSSTFDKDFTEESFKKDDTQLQKFIDIVPFEEVLSKIYKLGKKTKVVGINKSLYEIVKQALGKNNFSVSLVLPYSVLQEIYPELANSVNLAFIAGKIDSLKQYSLSGPEVDLQKDKEKTVKSKTQNKRVYLLIGVFAILFIILIALVISTLSSKPTSKNEAIVLPTLTPKPTEQAVVTQPQLSPTASESATTSPTISPIISR